MVGMRMDVDGDGFTGGVSGNPERIIRAMDADYDGTVILEEMRDFMRGVSRSAR